MSRPIGFVTCGDEVVEAFVFGEEVADGADSFPEVVVGAGGGLAQKGFQLGEGHFDGVEVGTIGRQGQEPAADILQDLRRLWAFVDREVVKNDHVARLQGGGELGLDVEVEQVAVDRAVDHPGRVQPVMAQGGDEGLGLPGAERGMVDQALAAWRPPGRLGHVGLD